MSGSHSELLMFTDLVALRFCGSPHQEDVAGRRIVWWQGYRGEPEEALPVHQGSASFREEQCCKAEWPRGAIAKPQGRAQESTANRVSLCLTGGSVGEY